MKWFVSNLWRMLKVTPVIGNVFILASIPEIMRRKGFVFGALAVTLDMLPVICLIKAGIEIFTGDLLPDCNRKRAAIFHPGLRASFSPLRRKKARWRLRRRRSLRPAAVRAAW